MTPAATRDIMSSAMQARDERYSITGFHEQKRLMTTQPGPKPVTRFAQVDRLETAVAENVRRRVNSIKNRAQEAA